MRHENDNANLDIELIPTERGFEVALRGNPLFELGSYSHLMKAYVRMMLATKGFAGMDVPDRKMVWNPADAQSDDGSIRFEAHARHGWPVDRFKSVVKASAEKMVVNIAGSVCVRDAVAA